MLDGIHNLPTAWFITPPPPISTPQQKQIFVKDKIKLSNMFKSQWTNLKRTLEARCNICPLAFRLLENLIFEGITPLETLTRRLDSSLPRPRVEPKIFTFVKNSLNFLIAKAMEESLKKGAPIRI